MKPDTAEFTEDLLDPDLPAILAGTSHLRRSHDTVIVDEAGQRNPLSVQSSRKQRKISTAWQTILADLTGQQAATPDEPHRNLALPSRSSSQGFWCLLRPSVVFSCIERQGNGALLVSWHDATAGHCSDQRWTRRLARVRGTCALTGKYIAQGMPIFKPTSRNALNAGAMFLEASIDEYFSQHALPDDAQVHDPDKCVTYTGTGG